MTNVKAPRLLGADRSTVAVLHPVRLSLDLPLRDACTAQIELTDKDPALSMHDLVHLYTATADVGLYRATDITRESFGHVRATLRHALDTLSDDVWPVTADAQGNVEPFDYTGTMADYLAAVLAQQTTVHWQLGTCDDTSDWTREGIFFSRLSDLISEVAQDREDYYFDFDFSTWPWTLNFKALPTTVTGELRLSRNVESATVTRSDADMCNKLYLSVNDGTTYGQAVNAALVVSAASDPPAVLVAEAPTTVPAAQVCLFRVTTPTSAMVLKLYAEDGTTEVSSWTASGNSSVSGGVRVWMVTRAIANAGDRTLTFKASADGSTFGTGKAVNLTVISDPVPSVLRVEAQAAALAGSPVTFRAWTPAEAAYLMMVSETGAVVNTWPASGNSVVSGSLRVWSVSWAIGTAGNRVLTFKTSVDGTAYNIGADCPVVVVSSAASLATYAVSVPAGAIVAGAGATLTVVTGTSASRVTMQTETRQTVATWEAAGNYSRASSGLLVWTLPYSFRDAGNRTLSFKAGSLDGPRLRVYNNTTSQALYGVIAKTADVSTEYVPDPDAWAQDFLAQRAAPAVQITVDGYELKTQTGMDWDALSRGQRVRVVLGDLERTTTRVEQITYPDVLGQPERVEVQLANRLPSFTETISQMRAVTKAVGGGAGGGGGSGRASADQLKHWAMIVRDTAEAADGTGLLQMWQSGIEIDAHGGVNIHSLFQGFESTYQAIDINQEGIRALVTRADDLETDVDAITGSQLWLQRDNITGTVGKFTIDNDGNVHVIDGSQLYLGTGSASLAVYDESSLTAGIIVDKINGGTVTINAARVNLNGYVTAIEFDALHADFNSVVTKSGQATTLHSTMLNVSSTITYQGNVYSPITIHFADTSTGTNRTLTVLARIN